MSERKYRVDENGDFHEITEKENIPMIPKHQAQAQAMHLTWIVKWLVIGIIIGFICNLAQSYIFVTGYTSRTKDWLITYRELRNNPAITEVANEEDSTGTIQQLPIQ